MIRIVSVAALMVVCIPGRTAAQDPATSFKELESRAIVGDIVSLVDVSGAETKGRVFAVSDTAIAIAVGRTRQEFAAADVRSIQRTRRDSVRNGVLIGAGAGALLGFMAGRSLDSPSCPNAPECGQGAVIGTVGGAFWGAIGGWITDALVRKREVVYVAAGGR